MFQDEGKQWEKTESKEDGPERHPEPGPEKMDRLVSSPAKEQGCLILKLMIWAMMCCEYNALVFQDTQQIFNPTAWCECVLWK